MESEVFNNVLMFASVLAVFVLALVQLVKTVNVPKNIVPLIGSV